ncbi:glycosyltransferase [Mesorhizobium sp. CO1-1-4]|uniref:glycosyltransferase n=1 Tax=Mesorhizobium sp. CO1-1-4 TaxID=2876633 RepID=UPI001CCABE3C|nr:nucleotide disphospho-sugar-binding domain-containing protein [Mesorhizobium sp. CO1-1-4]MBZ9740677.1 hypothetical protein [Mesorhizobium sp. CO1-1-4]
MAVSSMNECIRKLGGRQLDRVVDIFADTATAMVTFPELDHYGARPDLKYVGAIEYYDGGAVPVWPKGQGKRIFLYFRAASLVADKVMEALTAFPGVAICSIPDASADFRKKHESERVQIVTSPLDLRRVLETADLTITYGGLGLVSASALAGVPTLVIPQHSEQYLTAQRVAALGIGILFNQKSKLGNLGQHIEYILGANGMSDQAKRFSARHRNHQSSISAALVAEEASALMRT